MTFTSLYTFCPYCSASLTRQMEDGVDRRVCPQCNWIQYRNPTVGVAVVILKERKLLVGKRRRGGWCIPCGHVEYDETVEQAACREMLEETGLEVSVSSVLAVKSNFHNPHHQTVGVWFSGREVAGAPQAGGDLVELMFADLFDVPDLIFPTDREVLELIRDNR